MSWILLSDRHFSYAVPADIIIVYHAAVKYRARREVIEQMAPRYRAASRAQKILCWLHETSVQIEPS
jgi:hypothetical protein